MLRVVNPQPGEVIVAGASGGDALDGRLFTLRFVVVDPDGVESLTIRVDELNDRSFASQLTALRRAPRAVLDRGLAKAGEAQP
jgi:hypothetical protein